MKRTLFASISFFILITSCRGPLVCPTYQSYFIKDDAYREEYFSYFSGTDSVISPRPLPWTKTSLEYTKDKNGLIREKRWLVINTKTPIEFLPRKNIYLQPEKKESVLLDSISARLRVDTADVYLGLADESQLKPVELPEPPVQASTESKIAPFNWDQINYYRYVNPKLLDVAVETQDRLNNPEKYQEQETEVTSLETELSEKSSGSFFSSIGEFFSNLFGGLFGGNKNKEDDFEYEDTSPGNVPTPSNDSTSVSGEQKKVEDEEEEAFDPFDFDFEDDEDEEEAVPLEKPKKGKKESKKTEKSEDKKKSKKESKKKDSKKSEKKKAKKKKKRKEQINIAEPPKPKDDKKKDDEDDSDDF